MSKIATIKALMLLENCQSAFRRDLFNIKYSRYILSSVWPLSILCVLFYDGRLELAGSCLELQNFLVNFKTISIMFCCTYKSDKFYKMIKLIDNLHGFIRRERASSNMTKRLNTLVISAMLFVAIVGVVLMVLFWTGMPKEMTLCSSKEVIMFLHSVLFAADCLAFTEAMLYYCLCSVISYQLESLSELIRADMRSLQRGINGKLTIPKPCWRRWGDIYLNISDCVELLNSVFGLQITLIIAVTVLYFVYLFQIILAIKSLYFLFLVFLPQFLAILLISKAGQNIKCTAVELKRTLVRVKLKIVEEENEESFSAMSSLISVTSARPIRTKTFGSIATGYAMLPAVFVYFTTPLIIVLQFKV